MNGTFPGRQALLLALLFLLLLTVFLIGFQRSEQPFFPGGFDQVDYRCAAARVALGWQQGGASGFLAALQERCTAQGYGQTLVGGLAYLAGVDPAAAIFALYLMVLLLVWWALSDRGRQPRVGWWALVVLLSLASLRNDLGSATDFRPDFPGQFLWGAAAALALAGRCFSRLPEVLVGGVLLGLCLSTRSLTLVYTAGALPLWFVAAWVGPDREEARSGRSRRLRNLALGGGVAALLAAPFVVAKFGVLCDYYLANHISDKEVAARGFVGGWLTNLSYYAGTLALRHLGLTGALVALAVGLWGLRSRRGVRWVGPVSTLAGFLLPLLIMAAGPQLNPIVAGIVAPPLVLFALIPHLGRRAASPRGRSAWEVAAILALLLVWPVTFLHRCERDRARRLRHGHQEIGRVLDRALEEVGDRPVVVSTLPLIDAVSVRMLQLRAWETEGRLPDNLRGGLGHTIYACPSVAALVGKLMDSDLVFHQEVPSAGGGGVPADRQAWAHRERIKRILASAFRPADGLPADLRYNGKPLRMYIRRDR